MSVIFSTGIGWSAMFYEIHVNTGLHEGRDWVYRLHQLSQQAASTTGVHQRVIKSMLIE